MQLELPTPADPPAPLPLDRLLAQAAAAAQAQRRDDAQAILQQAITENPTSSAAWLACAALATDPVERLTFLDRAIGFEPGNARTRALAAKAKVQVIGHYGDLGLTAVRSGNMTAARQYFGEVIRLDPSHEASWLRLASLAETPEEQIALLKQTLRVNPANERTRASLLEAQQQLAKLYLRQAGADLQEGRQDPARETLRRALQLDPSCEDAWSLLALTSPDPDERRTCAEKLRALRRGPPQEPVIVLEPLDVAETTALDDQSFDDQPVDAAPAPVEALASDATAVEPTPDAMDRPDPDLPAAAVDATAAEPALDAPLDHGATNGRVMDPDVHPALPEAAALAADAPEPSADCARVEAPVPEAAPVVPVAAPVGAAAPPPAAAASRYVACPLCETIREVAEPVCSSCGGVTTLDDIATLLKPRRVNQARLDAAVTRLEPKAAARDAGADAALAFGLALLNVRRYSDGLAQLERAVTLRADDEALRALISGVVARLRPSRTAEAAPRATVLVVDDSPTIRRVVASKLEKLRCRVILAEDGAQALTQLRVTVPDLILLDITMPNVDGYQVCKAVKSQPDTKHVPVVFISGKDGFFDKARGRMAGSDAYVTKPFGPDALSRVLATFVPA